MSRGLESARRTQTPKSTGPGFPITVAAVALLSGACADPPSEGNNRVPGMRLEERARIDGRGPAGEGGFGRIADLEIGEDGTIFVLDDMNRTVRVFDEAGTPLRTFGGRGRGPAELERPRALAWGPAGHLWVVDAANARYSVFSTEGDLVATHPIQFREPAVDVLAVGFSDAGLLQTVNVELVGGSLERPRAVLVESEVAGGEVREVRRSELSFVEWPPTFRHQGPGAVLVQPIPFSSRPLFHLTPDGRLWYARSREPRVRRWSPSGGFDRTIGREFDPPPVTDVDLERALEGADELRESAPSAFAEFTSLIPETKPHLRAFFVDGAGHVWVMRPKRAGEETRPVDVYDADGRLIATLRSPLEPEPGPRVRGGVLAGVVRDALGVERVALYEVQR